MQQLRSEKETREETIIIEEKVTKFNGQTTVKKYERRQLLGKGGFARCYELINLQTKKVSAVKIVQKSSLSKPKTKQKLISEIKIHKSVKHPGIVQFEHVFEDSENVYIVLEICPNLTLNEMLKKRKKLTEIQMQIIVNQLLNVLRYLRTNRIIHRDLKLGNLFLAQNMDIKLGDFGLATRLQYDTEKKKTICGTPNYIAPQILEGKGHSYQVDIWSLGVLIFAGLFGKPPFQTPEVKKTYHRIRSCLYSFPQMSQISEPAKNLISRIFQLDPTKRPTIDEIFSSLFMNPGYQIPKSLQKSCLSFVPSKTFLEQSMPKRQYTSVNRPQQKMTFFPKEEQKQKQQKERPPKENTKEKMMFASTNGFFKSTSKQMRITQTQKLQTQTNFASMQSLPMSGKMTADEKSFGQIHVKKWIDYSLKYGLGYMLTNGSIGVHFNDLTKIILDPRSEQFDYIDSKNEKITRYSMDSYPKEKELNKKVTLLQHFKSELEEGLAVESQGREHDRALVFVKKWINSRHAMIFRLSNKIVQANFEDGTQIVLSSEKKTVVYLNKKKERSEHPLSSALQSRNYEMVKRLKYLKQVLMQMLNGDEANRANLASRQSRQSRF